MTNVIVVLVTIVVFQILRGTVIPNNTDRAKIFFYLGMIFAVFGAYLLCAVLMNRGAVNLPPALALLIVCGALAVLMLVTARRIDRKNDGIHPED